MKNASIPTYENINSDIILSHKTSTGDSSYPYHRHNVSEIILFLSGNIYFYIEKTCIIPPPDSIFIINKHEMHRVKCIDESTYDRIVINISDSYINHLSISGTDLSDCFYSRSSGKKNIFQLSYEQKDSFLKLYNKIQSNMDISICGNAVRRDAYTSILLQFINECYYSYNKEFHNSMPEEIVHIMQYLEHHLDEKLCISKLSLVSGLPSSQLSLSFKNHTGLTIREYFLDRKISKAKSLLQSGASVTDACFDSGFNDYANFIRSFKNKEGITPGKYRASSQIK